MNMQIYDVMLHIDEPLQPQERSEIEDEVRADSCVISVCFSPDDPHLMTVTFNPDCTNMESIRNRVTARGLHAELVGL